MPHSFLHPIFSISLCLSTLPFLSVSFQFSSALISLLIQACVIVASHHNFGRQFFSFSFLISCLIFGLTPPNPTTTPLPTPTPFFPSFLFCLSLFLQSFSSSFRTACFFQCSEVMVEYNRPAVAEKEGTNCSLCSERGQL